VKNPFATVGYLGPDTFCDRETETKKILSNIKNGRNTCLLAPRRLGKTALVQHVFHNLPNWTCIYIDIAGTATLSEFLKRITTGLYNAGHKGISVKQFLQSWKASIDFDPFTGGFSAGLAWVKPNQEKRTIEDIFKAVSKTKNIVIAFDEFQEITNYEDNSLEGWLRSMSTQFPTIRFLYCGSHQRILRDMFSNQKRPFYHSADLIQLGHIEPGTYANFMIAGFKKGKMKFSDKDHADWIYQYCRGFTAYIQEVCNSLYSLGAATLTEENIFKCIGDLLLKYEPYFLSYKNNLTKTQYAVLKGFATKDKVYKVNGKEFMTSVGIFNSSVINRTIESLLKSQFIYEDTDQKGKFYSMDNILFQRWIERQSQMIN
jgi:uncharacterized protein